MENQDPSNNASGDDPADLDRYHRLKIFDKADLTKLREKSLIVVGVGGTGALTSEIVTRLGIGRLVLFDFDVLKMANMNRLIYKPRQIGMTKVEAIREYLHEVNPDTTIEVYPFDITDEKGIVPFKTELKKCDAVLGCVDSFTVRLFMNAQCVKFDKPFIDSGASFDGMNGNVQVVIPKKTACYRCHKRGVGDKLPGKKIDDHTSKGMCHLTSLPTTMAIVSALQCQETLKLVLGFGNVAPLLVYSGMRGSVERIDWAWNSSCPVCGDEGE